MIIVFGCNDECLITVCSRFPPFPLLLVLSEFQCDQALCTLSQKAGSFLVTLIGECQIMNLLCKMSRFTLNKKNLILQSLVCVLYEFKAELKYLSLFCLRLTPKIKNEFTKINNV